jgi:hypothetical protein
MLAARRAPEKPAVTSGPDPQFGLATLAWQVDQSRSRDVERYKFMCDCVSTAGRLDQIDPLSNDASAQHHAGDPGARAETTEASDWPCSG